MRSSEKLLDQGSVAHQCRGTADIGLKLGLRIDTDIAEERGGEVVQTKCPTGYPTCFLFSSKRKSWETILAVLTFFQAFTKPFILTFESLQLTL